MKIKTRFAPSPTGLLHVGNVRTALINWLFTKKNGGSFTLRIDDTDLVRSTKEFTECIKQDLSWLKLDWDDLIFQSNRFERYTEIKNLLIKQGKLYPCYETPEELDIKRKLQLGQGKPPIYDRSALKLSDKQKEQLESSGKKPHYRFLLENRKISWQDLVRDEVTFAENSMSDPILIREDGSWTYMLCSVIDDIDLNITHIIRGEDHISNTAVQIQIFEILGARLPTFAHLARITSKEAKISKRVGGFDIQNLREEKGIEAMTINNFLATIGTSDPVSHFSEIEDIIEHFELSKFHKSPTNYDEDDLIRINHKILADSSFAEISPRLKQMNLNKIDKNFWLIVRKNLNTLNEIILWNNICFDKVIPIIDDKGFLNACAQCLPTDNWDETIWEKWMHNIISVTNKKGKELFLPIRFALTGIDHGPELKSMIYLLGKEKILKRLNGETA
jgi:glutamyl-tRNA synthetase